MEIKVLVFARLRELFGGDEVSLTLPDDARAKDVVDALIEVQPSLAESRSTLHIAINQDIAAPEQALQETDEIALFPPVGGG